MNTEYSACKLLRLDLAQVSAGLFQTMVRWKDHAKSYYIAVMLSAHPCPACGGQLRGEDDRTAACVACRRTFDPTETFQRSRCCDARLRFRRRHYACAKCDAPQRSVFLFDEQLFNADYFRERVAESRKRQQQAETELREMLLASRTPELAITELPGRDSIQDLDAALDQLLGTPRQGDSDGPVEGEFQLDTYRQWIRPRLQGCLVWFDAIPVMAPDPRMDRVRRFTALVFMEHDREVLLEQRGEGILVRSYEADAEG